MSASEGWLDALGKPVPLENIAACYRFTTVDCGLPASEAALVLPVVCREIEHDEPERAQKYMRSWMEEHQPYNAETSVIRALAILVT